MLVLAVCFTPSARAQNNTQVQSAPAEAPAKLVPDGTPAQPSADKPAMPSTDKPAQQGVITKQEPTTPEVIAAPEDTFFHPFKPAATTQITAPAHPGDAKPARMNVAPVLALKRRQAKELKALRESLKTRPNAEINKSVAAMEADHKAALKALEASNKAEAEKNIKVRVKPAKKGIKKQLNAEPAK